MITYVIHIACHSQRSKNFDRTFLCGLYVGVTLTLSLLQVNSFVSAYYDSVLYLALCLNRTFEDGLPTSDGLAVAQRLWNNTFRGEYTSALNCT